MEVLLPAPSGIQSRPPQGTGSKREAGKARVVVSVLRFKLCTKGGGLNAALQRLGSKWAGVKRSGLSWRTDASGGLTGDGIEPLNGDLPFGWTTVFAIASASNRFPGAGIKWIISHTLCPPFGSSRELNSPLPTAASASCSPGRPLPLPSSVPVLLSASQPRSSLLGACRRLRSGVRPRPMAGGKGKASPPKNDASPARGPSPSRLLAWRRVARACWGSPRGTRRAPDAKRETCHRAFSSFMKGDRRRLRAQAQPQLTFLARFS